MSFTGSGRLRLARQHPLSIIVLSAVGYFVCGKLGIYLAIPPGYATAVWPSSGVALALALRFGNASYLGTWIGSYLINAGISHAFDHPTAASLLMPGIIGLGAVFQAALGCKLVHHLVAQIWTRIPSVLTLLLLGGPVSCLLAASVGTTTLLLFEQISPELYRPIWSTWWIGDTLGVLTFTPILMVLLFFHDSVALSKRITVVLPLILVFLLVTVAYIFVRDFEEQQRHELVNAKLRQIKYDVEKELATTFEIADTLATYFSISKNRSQNDFRKFTRAFLVQHNSLQALEWVPRVSAQERLRFEQQIRDSGFSNFEIRERDAQGALQLATQRDEYFPVTYIEPLKGNETAHGFDLASNLPRKLLLQQAASTGNATISDPIHLVQLANNGFGYLLVEPVFDQGLQGFILMVFVPETLVRKSSPTAFDPALSLQIADTTDMNSPVSLLNSEPALVAYQADTAMSVLNRTWQLTLSPTLDFLNQVPHWQSYAVLLTGWPFITVLSVLLIMLTGRQLVIEQKVKEQTAALAEASQRAQQASRAKSDFLANMSHELRTPLNSIIGFTHQVLTKKKNQLDPRSEDSLQTVERNARHLLNLINDLLDISKIEAGKFELNFEHFNVLQLCRDVAEPFEQQARDKKLRLKIDVPAELELKADRLRIYQVLLNLVSNALKFTQQGDVSIKARAQTRRTADGIQFEVTDTGAGIAPDQQPLLFNKFVQLNAGKQTGSGTGLGLALAKEIATLHSGDIDLQSELGKGSTFQLWIPTHA